MSGQPQRQATGRRPADPGSTFTDAVFEHICRLILEQTGIVLDHNKRDMVYSRLTRRLRTLGIDDFAEYCRRIALPGNDELQECINALTTNLTSFFREKHHFEFLAEQGLPEILSRQRGRTPRIRIWSAGCSTGKEPYSIAMVLHETLRPDQLADCRILATDLDTEVLAQAASGIYEADGLDGVSEARRQRFFVNGSGQNAGHVRAQDALRALIAFRQLNLMGPWPMKGPFDVVFCRNVVIYFDKATQRRLFDRFAELITDGGLLFIGHSESLHNVTERFELIGRSIYRKIA